MQIKRVIRHCNRAAVAAAVVSLASLSVSSPAFAFAKPKTINNEKAEACVEQLRETGARNLGTIDIGGDSFSRFGVGDKGTSQNFSNCLEGAKGPWDDNYKETFFEFVDNFSYGKREGDTPLISSIAGSDGDMRYILVDAYERKYVLDLQKKISYDLVRIPVEGSIEAKGHWDGVYVDSSANCKNSYGDPCGTQYTRNSAGGYVKK